MLALLLASALSLPASAQDDSTARISAAAQRVIAHINAGRYDLLADEFNDKLRKSLPPEKAAAALKPLFVLYGKILTLDPPRPGASGWTVFPARCEEGTVDFKLALDGAGRVAGLFFAPNPPKGPVRERNATPLYLPFKGEWLIFWGGGSAEQNHHHGVGAQNFALDILGVGPNGSTRKGEGKSNADYYAYGREILAPGDGVVIKTIDGVPDNVPGEMNEESILGNAVFLRHAPDEVSLLVHLQPGSLRVKQGQSVRRGQALGLCGNSGHSSEPHLHYHLQNGPLIGDARPVKAYFAKVLVGPSGHEALRNDYSPVKGDVVRPEQPENQ